MGQWEDVAASAAQQELDRLGMERRLAVQALATIDVEVRKANAVLKALGLVEPKAKRKSPKSQAVSERALAELSEIILGFDGQQFSYGDVEGKLPHRSSSHIRAGMTILREAEYIGKAGKIQGTNKTSWRVLNRLGLQDQVKRGATDGVTA